MIWLLDYCLIISNLIKNDCKVGAMGNNVIDYILWLIISYLGQL